MKEKREKCPACEHEICLFEKNLNGYQIVRCKRCDLLFSFEVPSNEDLEKIYDHVYHTLENYQSKVKKLKKYIEHLQKPKGLSKFQLFFKRVYFSKLVPDGLIPFGFDRHRLLKKIDFQKGDKLLEVGCGAGQFLLSAETLGWEVEGIDVSRDIIKKCNPIHGLNTRTGRIENLYFQNNSYKAIVAWEVLEHIIEPIKFLMKVKTILKPGGLFACSVPNANLNKVRFYKGEPGPASLPPIHLNFWTRKSLRFFAEYHGFEIEYLAPGVLLNSLKGWNNSYTIFFLHQVASILRIKEGPNIFALLKPI